MASLHILKGPNAGQRMPLNKSVTIMGREQNDCDIVIPNQAVSRVHAQICQSQGQFFIEDLKSRNKTYVNNKAIEDRTALRDNDRIKICDALFTFHCAADGLPPLPEEIRRNELNTEEDLELPSTVQATLARLPQQQLLEAQPAERLRALLDITGHLAQTLEPEKLLDRIAETLFQTFRQADRCFIIMKDEVTNQLIVRTFRSRRPSEETPRFSRTIVRNCLEQMQAFLVEDAATDSKFSLSQSITDFRIRSVMIAPMGSNEGPAFGVIQLDTQDRSKRFTQEDLKLLTSVAYQASIAIENSRLHEEQVRRERVLRDIDLAEQVQRSFLPQELPNVPGYEFYAHYKSAMTIGGDYYDFIQLPDGRWSILLGDVAGKGVAAALLMAKLSAEVRFNMMTMPDAATAFTKLNDFILKAGLSDRFITLAAAVLDPAKHRITIVNGGHQPPLLYKASREDLTEVISQEATGFPLGVMPNQTYQMVETSFEPGDSLLLFTDGITDALNPQNKPFKLEGVRKALSSESAIGESVLSPAQLGTKLVEAVRAHIAGRDQYDDIALVSFGRYDGPTGSATFTKLGV
ncbi:MAG: SpoIIE family protein phosphatase [Gemmataceae bacterium]